MSVRLILPGSREWQSTAWGWIDTIHNSLEQNRSLRALFVKGGQSTEMHRHAQRDVTFVCDDGQVAVEYLLKTPHSALEHTTNFGAHVLSHGMAVHIPANTWHRIVGIEDAYLWASSGFCDDTDREVLENREISMLRGEGE